MKKTIITVVGKDTVGIIAGVCSYLAENNVNILDISQTIVQEYFNMMMIVDCNKASKPINELSDDLDKLGEKIGVSIKMQHEDIELAILQSRSPTCGVNQIYDGSFTGKLISGMGLFAKALKERGIKVIDVEEVESFNLLDCPQLQSI